MKKLVFFISVLILLPATMLARAFIDVEWYSVDSLLQVLNEQNGVEKTRTLNRLAATLSFEDAIRSKYFADKAMTMAGKLNYLQGVAEANRNYGRIHFYEGNYPDALNFYYEAMQAFEEIGDLKKVAAMYMEIATTHFYANNIEKAIEIAVNHVIPLYRSKDISGNTVGDFHDTLRTFSKLGLPYRMTGRSDTSLLIYQRYLEAGRNHGIDITDMMVHQALVAGCFLEIGNTDSAIFHYRKTLAYPLINQSIIALKHEYMRRLASIFKNMGMIDSAFYYYNSAYWWHEKNGYLRSGFLAARELGILQKETGNNLEAETYWLKAAALVEEMMGKRSFYRFDSLKYTVSFGTELYLPYSKKRVRETIFKYATWIYHDLSGYYQKTGNLPFAMQYLLAYTAAKDTLEMLTKNREAIEIQTRFETKRKDAEILALSQANVLKELRLIKFSYFIGALAGMVIIIIFFATILNRQSKIKNSRKNLLLQQRLLRSQLNPHFIFNSLASIQNKIITEQPDLATEYLARFSHLFRNILDGSAVEFIPLYKEIETIKNYLELQSVRFAGMFDYHVVVDEKLDPESISIPPMLAQPFIENAIEHGMKHKNGKGHISVRFEKQNTGMNMIIEDNGIGREKAGDICRSVNKGHKSMATTITCERIKLLNKKLKIKIAMEIIDLKDETGEAKGTRVVFEIPFKN